MFNIPGNTKDYSNENDSKKSSIPPLVGLEAIAEQRIEKNRTPNINYFNQNKNIEDDGFIVPKYIYSPTPIDKSTNSWNISTSPPMISPDAFNTNRYSSSINNAFAFSPSYMPSPNSAMTLPPRDTPSQSQPQPLSMSSLLSTTNEIALPKSEPAFNPPISKMPPPSSSPLSYIPPVSKTPKFDELPTLSGDLYNSTLFNEATKIDGISGILAKTTLDNNNEIPLYQSSFDISNYLSSLSSATTTNNNHIRNKNMFSDIPISKPPPLPSSSLSSILSSTSLSSSSESTGSNSGNDSFSPTEIDISNYEELIKELVVCQMCGQRLQKVKCFIYNNGYLCCSCSGKISNRKTLGDWEIEEQNGVLCKRLNHHKNRISYMKKQANGSFKIETLCIFCRNMKSYEYYRKQESKISK